MRETKKITTKNGNVIEVFSYITGKDVREYQRALFGSLKLSTGGAEINGVQTPKIDEIPASILLELDSKMIELLVVSVDGVKENVVEKVIELKAEDYNELINELRLFFRV